MKPLPPPKQDSDNTDEQTQVASTTQFSRFLAGLEKAAPGQAEPPQLADEIAELSATQQFDATQMIFPIAAEPTQITPPANTTQLTNPTLPHSPQSIAAKPPIAEAASIAPPMPMPMPAPMPPAPNFIGQVPASNRQHGIALPAFLGLALLLTLATGLLLFLGLRFLLRPEPSITGANLTSNVAGDPLATATLPTLPMPTPTVGLQLAPWNGKERFTILLLGLDKRPRDTGTAFRTDSMILLSLDPATGSLGMLSVPRDLYVEIPADTVVGSYYGLQRVNTGYYLGEIARPGYGPRLAVQTVQYNLGIRIHDYIVYDFEAVIALIDAVGGIDILVEKAIYDAEYPDMYGGYEPPLSIKAGQQHMDGALALKYARTRHGSSDIERARRQQQVILALRDRVLQQDLIPTLLLNAPALWAKLGNNLRSGLSLEQLLQLALYAKDINPQNVRKGVIDYRYVQDAMWNGQAVLVPNRAAIGGLLSEVFGPNYNN
jgi:polyisoprenyl-teichoic acid--peptidoglycan teichoic acid transferase